MSLVESGPILISTTRLHQPGQVLGATLASVVLVVTQSLECCAAHVEPAFHVVESFDSHKYRSGECIEIIRFRIR
jgi:hypothetical protein